MSSKGPGHNKFVRIITIPFRALAKAKDLYVKSLTSCAARANLGGGYGDYYSSGLPRSFSTSSVASTNSYDNEDFRELMRAASVRSLGHRNEMEMFLQEQLKQMRLQQAKGSTTTTTTLPKSCSVGMGRIDEDKPFEFEEKDDDDDVGGGKKQDSLNNQKKKQDSLFKRSRSYAVTKRSSVSFDSY